ncbi:uncharacterized protein LOC127279588 [Leptopilina boulardi]|uniref:uncharacterized protein LOC127279588 n=1 Tax=Leptopilina boulardi TaxID=63433 RepID=UPI0021F5E89F|nr:uncharacterized protein LOC127279588 [Leptopilina boulardi]
MVSKLINPVMTWRQYDILKYLKKTNTLEKGKEKLLEALVMSEIDSEINEDYADKYKKSRQHRAKTNTLTENSKLNENPMKKQENIQTPEPINQFVTNKVDGVLENDRCKVKLQPKIIDNKILKTKFLLPLPPAKRVRTDSETENNLVHEVSPSFEYGPSKRNLETKNID